MNKYMLLTAVVSIAAGVAACSGGANTNISVKTSNNANAANTNVNSSANAAVTNASPAAADTAVATPGSPSEAYKTAHYARQKKDIATLKKVFAKDILEFFTEIGKADKKSLDDMLLEMCEKAEPGEPEIRNEKITGDKATLEYKDEGEWKTVDFLKEDGAWKMTIPKADDKETKDKK